MKSTSFLVLLFTFSISLGQTVALPVDFESGAVVTSDFTNFDGGTGTVIANPQIGGINTSATVGQIVRNGGQPWAGAYLTTASNVDFSVNPIICMKVYTDAPIGTNISLKMEGCGGGCSFEIPAFTTVTGDWETLCYDFTGQPANFNRLVFLFDLGNIGDGSTTSTFLFDCIEQLATLPLLPTPGSQYFCPNSVLDLTFPGSGNYNWYSDPAGTILLEAGSSTHTTSLLTGDTSYFVKDMSSSPFPATDIGPSIPGGTAIGNSLTVSTFFTSNLDNGFFHSVDILLHIPTGPVPGNTCTYQVDIFNITQGTSRTLTQGFASPANFSQHAYVFGTPLPIFLNDQLEMRITSLTGHPCYCISSSAGDNGLFLPFPNSYDPQITFTAHTSNGTPNTLMSGQDYNMSGDFVDPTLAQVNAIDNCLLALPLELIEFTVHQKGDDAVLNWTTVSETNNDFFTIRRTVDGTHFETVGSVPGARNALALNQYSFTDSEAKEGLNYYQLTQVDYDGSTSLSQVVALTKAASNDFRVSPNPTAGTFTLTSTFKVTTSMKIQIQDPIGRIIKQYDTTVSQGVFEKACDIRDFPAGIYLVTIRTANKSEVFKIMKN